MRIPVGLDAETTMQLEHMNVRLRRLLRDASRLRRAMSRIIRKQLKCIASR
jgi:hypothetical protein